MPGSTHPKGSRSPLPSAFAEEHSEVTSPEVTLPRTAPPPSELPQAATEVPFPPRKAVYTIIEPGSGRSRWVRIGIAFVNRDSSLNVRLDALPVNAMLHIRDFPEQPAQEEPGE